MECLFDANFFICLYDIVNAKKSLAFGGLVKLYD